MASTYTTNTGIEKIGTGEQSGTWGTTTNLNLDIIDRAVNGVGSITLSGTTHTLTTSDGTLSDGMFKVLVLSGSPSGTNTITIAPNDAQKFYVVINSSGESAIFTQGSGGNATVADGVTKIIYADGAGAGAEVVDLSSTLVANTLGTLSIVGGNLVPDADGTRDLGTDATRFANIFADNFTSGDLILDNTTREFTNNVDGTQGRWRIQEGSDDLFIINESNGKQYRFSLEEI